MYHAKRTGRDNSALYSASLTTEILQRMELDVSLRAALEVQLREDRADVVLHGLVREEDLGRDLLVGLPLGDEREDLLLLLGQLRELVRIGAGRDPPDPVEHLLGDRRVEERLAAPHRLERRDEVAGADLLEQVPRGAGDDRGEDRLLVGVAREDHDLRPRVLGADVAAGLDPGAVREPDVHDDDVGLELAAHLGRLRDRARLGDDLEPLAPIEERDEPLPDDLVVVDDDEPQRACELTLGHRCHPPLPLSVTRRPARARA